MSSEKVEIPHERDGESVIGFGAYRVLESFDRAASEDLRDDVRRRLHRAMRDFPELAHETVTVARLDPDRTPDGVTGQAGVLNRLVYLPTEHHSSMQTVYHELAHLAIEIQDEQGEDVPTTSEEYCSILAVSRMPADLIERDDISYLGQPSVPQSEWPEICQRALEYREEHHDYIQQCKQWLGISA